MALVVLLLSCLSCDGLWVPSAAPSTMAGACKVLMSGVSDDGVGASNGAVAIRSGAVLAYSAAPSRASSCAGPALASTANVTHSMFADDHDPVATVPTALACGVSASSPSSLYRSSNQAALETIAVTRMRVVAPTNPQSWLAAARHTRRFIYDQRPAPVTAHLCQPLWPVCPARSVNLSLHEQDDDGPGAFVAPLALSCTWLSWFGYTFASLCVCAHGPECWYLLAAVLARLRRRLLNDCNIGMWGWAGPKGGVRLWAPGDREGGACTAGERVHGIVGRVGHGFSCVMPFG